MKKAASNYKKRFLFKKDFYKYTSCISFILLSIILNFNFCTNANCQEYLSLPESDKVDLDDITNGLDSFNEELQFYQIEQTVVSASKRSQSVTEAPAAITIITSNQIRNSGAVSLSEVFRRVPNMDVYYITSFHSTIGIRTESTESNDTILVMIDWREINIDSFGLPLWEAIPITLSDIDRIEIIRGPASTLHGANAFNGIINIITKQPDKPFKMSFDFKAGEFNSTYASIQALGKQGNFSYRLSAGYDTTDSYSDAPRLGRKVGKANGFVNYLINRKSNLSFDIGHSESQGIITFLTGDNNIERLQQSYLRTEYSNGNFKFRSYINRFAFVKGHGDFDFNAYTDTQDEAALGYELINGNEDIMGELVTVKSVKDQVLSWDAEALYDMVPIPNSVLTLGIQTRRTSLTVDTKADYLRVKPPVEWRLGTFFNFEYKPVVGLIFTAGLRSDINTLARNILNPRLNVTWSPVYEHTFRLGYIQAFRKPSMLNHSFKINLRKTENSTNEMLDLAYTESPRENPTYLVQQVMQNSIGKKDLDSEKVYGIDAGYLARLFKAKLRLNLDVYYYFFRDFIEFPSSKDDIILSKGCINKIDPIDKGICEASAVQTFQNVQSPVDAYGVEFTASYSILKSLNYWFNASYRQVNNVTKRWPWSENSSTHYEQWSNEKNLETEDAYSYYKLVDYVPFWHFNSGIEYHQESGLQFSLLGHYVSAIGSYFLRGTDSALLPTHFYYIKPVLIINTFISYCFNLNNYKFETGLMGENLLDSNQREQAGSTKIGVDGNIYGQDPGSLGLNEVDYANYKTAIGAEKHRRKVMAFIRGEF